MSQKPLKIAAVDISHIFRMAWHAGEHKALSFAYQQTLDKVGQIQGRGYDRVVVAVDRPPYFRSTLYPDYKGQREDPGQVFRDQLSDVLKALDSRGCLIWGVDTFEADDVIAALCQVSRSEKFKIDIWTGDKDLLQLVDDEAGVSAVSVRTGEVSSEAEVVAAFGVHPKEIVDFLSLVGDKSDNIPGLPGCGPKTAAAALTVASLDRILELAEQGLAVEGMGDKLAERLSDPDCIKSIKTGRELIRLSPPVISAEMWSELKNGKRRFVKEETLEVEAEGEEVLENSDIERVTPDAPQAGSLANGISVSTLVQRVKKIQSIHKQIMVNDVHFGIIPGVKKPSLLKPGAELLGMAFQLAPEFKVEKERDGAHMDVTVTCFLVHQGTGVKVGSGMGSCSTRESRYAYRRGERKCPKCGASTIFKSKQGGGWFCWSSKGGCGEQFTDKDQSIIGQNLDRVDNPDLPDVYNTVLKMAMKRAHVSAILFATCASEIFTQDVEDMPEFGGGA